MPTDAGLPVFWPLGVYFAGVLVVVTGMVVSSYLLGGRSRDRKNVLPYESGIISTGSARVRLSADFYLFAMFFVIFDLESVFVYTWAIAVEDLGWPGYASVSVFILSLAAALFYLWRLGALDSKK
jgi:NADH-quinone oxidoreductase subunit A